MLMFCGTGRLFHLLSTDVEGITWKEHMRVLPPKSYLLIVGIEPNDLAGQSVLNTDSGQVFSGLNDVADSPH
jgi:hypothetical protein